MGAPLPPSKLARPLRRRRRRPLRPSVFGFLLGPLVEDLLQELLGGVGPDVAVGLRVEQRLLERARTGAGHVLHPATHPTEQRLAVVRVGVQRHPERRAGLGLVARHELGQRRPQLGAPLAFVRLGGRLEQRRRVGGPFQLHERLGGDQAGLDADVPLVDRMDAGQILHRILVPLLVVGEAAERMRRSDERLGLRLAEGVLDPVGAQLLGLRFATGQHDPQLFLGPVGVPGRQAGHPDADVGVGQLGVDCQRGAKLLLGGPRAALLEQAPALGHVLLGVRCDGRRDGGLLVGGEVALLVLFPRAAGATVVPAGRGEARARLFRVGLVRFVVLAGGGLAGGGLGHFRSSVVAGDGTIP